MVPLPSVSLGLTTSPGRQQVSTVSSLLYGGAAAAVIALHLATNRTLGFHTDELYYLDAGRHPAFGYVDFPPIVPLLARVETGLLGVSPWTLRLLPSLLGGFLVALSGLYVRRLGGSPGLQAIALLTAAAAPFLLGSNWVFQTVTFDQVTWMVAMYWFLCVVLDRSPRHWIYLGITLGIGLEVKFTIIGFIAGIAVAVVLTPALRSELRTRYPWIAAAIALLIWAPNLVWQVGEGFPTLTYVTNHGGSGGGPLVYLIQFGVYFFFLIPVWLIGMVSVFRSPVLRPIGIASAVPLVLFLFGGKAYYAAGTVPVVVAQGLIAISNVRRPRFRRALTIAAMVAGVLDFVVFFFLVVPIYGSLPESERSSTVIISAYYGVPGALQVYVDPARRPAAYSPQLSDWYLLPPDLSPTYALMIDYRPSDVEWMCNSPTLIGHLTVPYQVMGLEQGAPITFCPLKASIQTDWGRLRNFS